METIHYTKGDDFCVFIEKRLNTWFKICGEGRVAFTEGEYLDSEEAKKEFSRLSSLGYKSDWSLALREITGYLSCSCVLVFVAGYTCGSWVHRLNERFTRILLRR